MVARAHQPLHEARSRDEYYCDPQVPLSPDEEASQQDKKPSKMAIGGDGGFQLEKDSTKIEKEHALVLMPQKTRIPLPCPDLPEIVLQSIQAVMVRTCIAHFSAISSCLAPAGGL
jgi:hypothetical protein